MREVRFFSDGDDRPPNPDIHVGRITPPGLNAEAQITPDGGNTWAGTSTRAPVPPFWTIRAVLEGPVDPRSGYLCDIKQIDSAVRRYVAPPLHPRTRDDHGLGVSDLARRLRLAFGDVASHAPPPARLESLQLRLSPFTHLTVDRGDAAIDRGASLMVRLTQSFEFSASHRLYCVGLTDEENRRLFGKCSNPNGHGHNYVLEVTIAGDPDSRTGVVIDVAALDRIVGERVIEPLDHKNLNVECPEFATLNPTVENIARVIFRRLSDALGDGRLVEVRVWETPKTYAEYAGEG
jgi:6-pyruvoyltetrahydropterin/6-carboxytetrahydropterin synthase